MTKFSIQQIREAFSKVGLEKGDTLFIHSSLLQFGIPHDIKISELPPKLFALLCEKIGEEGTIAVPTFNFDFCKGKPYNRQETPSQNMGVFSEYIRKLPQSIRSFNPMQSISIMGKHAEYITENDAESAFSPDSAIDRLIRLNPKVLLLGNFYQVDSLIHWTEQKHAVPYRYWKTFSGQYTDHGKTTEKTYKMYVRDLEMNPELNFVPLSRELNKNSQSLKEAKVGDGYIRTFNNRDALEAAGKLIRQNPYYFVSNHPKFGKL